MKRLEAAASGAPVTRRVREEYRGRRVLRKCLLSARNAANLLFAGEG